MITVIAMIAKHLVSPLFFVLPESKMIGFLLPKGWDGLEPHYDLITFNCICLTAFSRPLVRKTPLLRVCAEGSIHEPSQARTLEASECLQSMPTLTG